MWISTPYLKLDCHGPTDRPFTPFGDPAVSSPILTRLAAVIARSPNALAIEDSHGCMTFRELERAIALLAAAIKRTSTGNGPIGIILGNERAYVVAIFACLAVRRIAVLLDASYPAARNSAIAAAAGITLYIAHSARHSLEQSGAAVLDVGEASEVMRAMPPNLPDCTVVDIDAPAFIICTSGSSGAPKLIVHSQRTILHWSRCSHDAMHVSQDDRALSLSSPSGLGGFIPLLFFPLAGGTLQMLEINEVGIGGMLRVLAARNVSILRAAPSLLRAVARLPECTEAFARIRIVQTFGEGLTHADLQQLRTVLSSECHIRSTYGTTEASGLSCFVRSDDVRHLSNAASGTLLPDTEAVVLDENGLPCPPDVTGELVIRSRYNALGEWSNGRLVPGRLIPDSSDPLRRLFHTGDLARHYADGVFVIVERKDRMLNINGQRVEPAEVEILLRQHFGVEEVEVIPTKRSGTATMTAFVVPKPDTEGSLEATLRAFLRSRVPSFMVPARFVLLKEIPRLPGGKVDVRTLQTLAPDSIDVIGPTIREVKFPETRGGTESGATLDKGRCALGEADFDVGKG